VGFAIVCVAVAAAAIATASGWLMLPDPLSVLDRRLPGIFRIHMLTGGLGLALLPLAFTTRRVGHRWHRPAGRAAMAALAIASIAGVASAAMSVATPLARAGFAAQGLLTIVLLAAAFRSVRSGQTHRHARLMQAAAAVVSGIIVLRLGTWIAAYAPLDFEMAYAWLAWSSWLLPLLIVAAWQLRAGKALPLRPLDGRPISSRH
jgi:uncharacterized membrane protein